MGFPVLGASGAMPKDLRGLESPKALPAKSAGNRGGNPCGPLQGGSRRMSRAGSLGAPRRRGGMRGEGKGEGGARRRGRWRAVGRTGVFPGRQIGVIPENLLFTYIDTDTSGTMEAYTNFNYLDYSNEDIFKVLFSMVRPIMYAGDFLRRTRREYIVKYKIAELENMPQENKEEIIDFMINCLPKDTSIQAFEESFERSKTISQDSKFSEYIEKVGTVFEMLRPDERRMLYQNLVSRIIGTINGIRIAVQDRILNCKNPGDVLLLDQTLIVCKRLADGISAALKAEGKCPEGAFALLFILLLEIEALRRGKIDKKQLYHDLAFTISQMREEFAPVKSSRELFQVLSV